MNQFSRQHRRLCGATAASAVAALLALGAVRSDAASSPPPYAAVYALHAASGGTTTLTAVRADGSDRLSLTDGKSLDIPELWSPDQQTLAFSRIDPTGIYSEIWLVGLDGKPPRILDGGYAEFPDWSQDGRWLAYQQQEDYGSMGARADTMISLYVSNGDGSGAKELGLGGAGCGSADFVGFGAAWAWSPDSRHIALVAPTNLTGDALCDSPLGLRIIDVTTGRTTVKVAPLPTNFEGSWTGWDWSPDGRRLAFLRPGGSPPNPDSKRLRVAVLDLKRRSVLASPTAVATRHVKVDGYPESLATAGDGWSWSPDSTRLAVVQGDPAHPTNLRLAVIDVATSRLWRLPGPLSTAVVNGDSLTTQSRSSPVGTRIAYFTQKTNGATPQLAIADLKQHRLRALGTATAAAWSPDGNQIALATTAAATGCKPLRIISVRTAARTTVPFPAGACDGNPAWSPDGNQLAFTRTQGKTQMPFILTSDGTVQPLTNAASSQLVLPETCQGYGFAYAGGWILNDTTGRPRLLRKPPIPANTANELPTWTAWRF